MLVLDRTKREGPHLEWRVRAFAVAAVFGLAGIYFDDRWLTGLAIVLLLVGFALRFAKPGAHATGTGPEDEPPDVG